MSVSEMFRVLVHMQFMIEDIILVYRNVMLLLYMRKVRRPIDIEVDVCRNRP